MTFESTQSFLGWCTLINVGLLTWWFLMFWLAHDWIYRIHGRLFKIPVETFDAIHYAGMTAYKVGVFLLNLVPYLALAIMR
ncbi:DUF6868 family protein [Bythopirellula goksoeyrii]|uniref:DUF6868 domain-containing protein n=1 Tax=Bythopirellula goksoeyrii TaxID=1400387 RepID=A0A5B9Q9W8_9BACT|nr:hypothetical protein [Bythopirellula goksoeyrii]QEG33696.1 hypothetical protein Pr1d_09610 [Bythopirellula goksoeyrii]